MVLTRSFVALFLLLVLLYVPTIDAKEPDHAPAIGSIDGKTVSPESSRPDKRVKSFHSALEAGGFIVREGSTRKVDILQYVNERSLDSAAGNNAGQFYKRFQVPSHPMGEDRSRLEIDYGSFRMNADEAIVYVGPTPPQCDYFSFCPFLFVRHYEGALKKGTWLFASAGDPLNNALIKTEGPGGPFYKKTIVIFAADALIYRRIEKIALASGYPKSMINSYVIPSSVLKLGAKINNDTLLILMRTANVDNKNDEDSYLNNNHYGTVYRVSPKQTPDILKPFDWPDARPRDVAPEGGKYDANLRAGLKRLKAAIVAKTHHVSSRSFDSIRWFYDSRDVLKEDPNSPAYRQFVAGESSDTPYLRITENGVDPATFTLGSKDMVVVYGVNHAATGLATYSSFGVYGEWKTNVDCEPNYRTGCNDFIWNGVAGGNNHNFTGSAERYIPGDPMAPFLYAVRVVRGTCPKNDRYCVVLPEPTMPWWLSSSDPGTADGIGLDQPAMVGYRAYLNPVTKSGPSYNDIIPDRAIWFQLQ
jgi:hypothetical protein